MKTGFFTALAVIILFGLLVAGFACFFAAAARMPVDYELTVRNFYSWASLLASLGVCIFVMVENDIDEKERNGALIAVAMLSIPGFYLLGKILLY